MSTPSRIETGKGGAAHMNPSPCPRIPAVQFHGPLAYVHSRYGEAGVRRLTAGRVGGIYGVRGKCEPERIVPIGWRSTLTQSRR
jgi:hypothetical protein